MPSPDLRPSPLRPARGSGRALAPRPARRTALATGLATGLAALLAAACAREPERPNVLLITVDTLRADRVGAGLTPELDALAAGGLVFPRTQAPRAKTTPSVASLMTGLYPHDHGVRDLTMPLAPDVPVLAEELRAAGWRTAALVGNFVLKDEHAGLARGFEVWVEDLPDELGVPPDEVPQRTARSLTDGALAALGLGPPDPRAGPAQPLARDGDEPWFLWLHYMDPHGVYDPPPEHRTDPPPAPEPLPPAPPEGAPHRRWVAEYNVPAEARLPGGEIDVARVRALYDGEVRYTDHEIGRHHAALRAAGELEDTLIVFTSDHGESLGEHEYWFEHGRYAYEATCRVPLVVRLPGADAPRGVRGADVSLVDLAPTLLAHLGLRPLAPPPDAAPGGPRGRARTELLARDDPQASAVFCEKVERAEKSGTVQTKAVRIGDWKLLRRYTYRWDEGEVDDRGLVVLSEELYDLAADPDEERDLAARPPAEAPLDRLRAELLRFAAADVRFADLARTLQEHREELERTDPQTLRILESLGY